LVESLDLVKIYIQI